MKLPDLKYEKKLWKRGVLTVAGVDEVGRGCFAGPVVAGCVTFPKCTNMQSAHDSKVIINDSKKLSKLQRELASEWIKENALTFGIGVGSVAKINKYGIISATNYAFRSAIRNAQLSAEISIQYLLVDAFYIPYVRGFRMPIKSAGKRMATDDNAVSQLAIVKGDAISLSISAASILAKVYRDMLMKKLGLDPKYEKYDWVNNKGYGTKKHQEALLKYGQTKLHRSVFVNTFLQKRSF